jgi:hypothetical protein
MPTVATINGVKIQFYPDEHPPPHFHAVFAEFTAQIQIDPPLVLRGSLPQNKLEAVMTWTFSSREGLMHTWMVLASGQKPGKLK